MPLDPARTFHPLNIAVLTVSDTRGLAEDRSGDALVAMLTSAGHSLAQRDVIRDELDDIIEWLSDAIADPGIQVVLTTGGTGVTGRDVTPEAVEAVATKMIPGFGELFRWQSYQSIGTSTVQSRACACVAGNTYVFALPGSTGAVRDAWNGILRDQLDSRHHPCNFAELLPRLTER